MNFTVEGTDQTHIFRALMGLYLGMVTFCIIAAHAGVAACGGDLGGVLRLLTGPRADPQPHHRRHAEPQSPILLFYLAVELTVGTLGLLVLKRERRKEDSMAKV